jgi:hypothetical protein
MGRCAAAALSVCGFAIPLAGCDAAEDPGAAFCASGAVCAIVKAAAPHSTPAITHVFLTIFPRTFLAVRIRFCFLLAREKSGSSYQRRIFLQESDAPFLGGVARKVLP